MPLTNTPGLCGIPLAEQLSGKQFDAIQGKRLPAAIGDDRLDGNGSFACRLGDKRHVELPLALSKDKGVLFRA